MKKNIISFLTLVIFTLPVVVYGASLIPCGQPAGTPDIIVNGASYTTTNPCGFNDLMILANIIVHFLVYDVVVPLVAIVFMAVGANYVINLDKESARSDAKKRLELVGIGIFWILASFVLVKVILYAFLKTDQGFTLFLLN